MLEMEEPDNAIIFCNTRDDTALVTAVLNRNGFDAELLNGDLPQKERERVMAQGEARRGGLHGRHRHRRARHRHLRPGVRHQLLAARGPGGVPAPGGPHRPHRQEGHRASTSSPAASWPPSPRSRRSTASSSRSGRCPRPRRRCTMWTERHVREIREAAAGSVYEGFLPLAGAAQAAPGRRRPDRLPAQVLLQPPAHGEAQGGGRPDAGAGARGCAAASRARAFQGRPAAARGARRARSASRTT